MPKPNLQPSEPMRFRFPDNPNEAGPAILLDLKKREPGEWVGQYKWDGWRSLLYKQNGQWVRHSKYDTGLQAKTPIPATLIQELNALNFPDGTAFDGEWMGMRAVNHLNGRHYLILYDLHYHEGLWQGDKPYAQRLALLTNLFDTHKARCKVQTLNIELIESSPGAAGTGNLLELFQRAKTMPLTEGIVVKRLDSKLKGGLADSAKNPQWIKVKWRQ